MDFLGTSEELQFAPLQQPITQEFTTNNGLSVEDFSFMDEVVVAEISAME